MTVADLVIFGTGDVARLAHYYFTRDSGHTVAAFAVDAAHRRSATFLDLPLVDFETVAITYPPGRYQLFVAAGHAEMNRVRAEMYYRVKRLGYELATYVSSRCFFLTEKPPGENCFILEGNTVQPYVTIGNDVTLWSGSHVGHGAVIEDHCFISSHVVVGSSVRVGQYSFLDASATVRDGVVIAPETLASAGVVISRDTAERGVYVPGDPNPLSMRSDEVEP